VAGRVLFKDVKPYFAPASLRDLRGPRSGVIALPHDVRWAPGDGCIDLDAPGGTQVAYQALLSEAAVEVQCALLERDRLVRFWPLLRLPARVRSLWETRFPELAQRRDG